MKQQLNFKLKILYVGVGPARCMTSWFTNQIHLNSTIYVPGRKEVNLLHKDKLDINHYYNIVSNNNKETEAIDYSNNYTLCIKKVQKNCQLLADNYNLKIKYVFFYRDPILRLQSHLNLLNNRGVTIKHDYENDEHLSSASLQSFYYRNIENTYHKNFLFINVDEINIKYSNNIDKINIFLNKKNLKFDINKRVGRVGKPRFLFIEKLRQLVFGFCINNDLDFFIKLVKYLRLNIILKYFNTSNFSNSVKIDTKLKLKILNDYKKFNLLIKNI